MLTEASLGRPLDDGLLEMSERMVSKNFEFAITAVTIQRQVGGSLATLFDMVADTVRQRQQFTRKIRALTAMGRMSAYTLIGIPFFLAGVITIVNRTYMRPLYWTRTGHMLIAHRTGDDRHRLTHPEKNRLFPRLMTCHDSDSCHRSNGGRRVLLRGARDHADAKPPEPRAPRCQLRPPPHRHREGAATLPRACARSVHDQGRRLMLRINPRVAVGRACRTS